MNDGRFVFSQMTDFLPKRAFERMVDKRPCRTKDWSLSFWNHLLVLMFGQLSGCSSLREISDVLCAHPKKSFHLGFGNIPPTRSVISKANMLRDPAVFEWLAAEMMSKAQALRIDDSFPMFGKFYAIDSSTINLCMSVFRWARFRSTKSGIKLHAQVDVATKIPYFYDLTNANVHDVNFLDKVDYQPLACYIVDRGYWDLKRLNKIDSAHSFFVIREKFHPHFELTSQGDGYESDNIMADQTVRFTGSPNRSNYPSEIRRIQCYIPELSRTFVFYTNNFYLKADEISMLYKHRWQIELFFKWIKQHLKVKRFWGESENSVRIQIHVAIATYCLVAILEKSLKTDRNIFEVMRILGNSLLTKDPIIDLFVPSLEVPKGDDGQLQLDFGFD